MITLDRTRTKFGSIGHPYTILNTTAIRTPETRLSTVLKEADRVGTTILAEDIPRVGHKHSLSEGIPTRRETNSLDH